MIGRDTMYDTTVDIEQQISSKLFLVNIVVSQMNLRATKMLDYDDYISVGIIGLYDAFLKFDTKRNVNFDTYAKFRIRGAIIDEMRRVGEISRNRMSKLNEFYGKANELRNQLDREPSDDEICTALGLTQEELNDLYQIMHFLSKESLDNTLYGEMPVVGFVEDRKEDLPEQVLLKKESHAELKEKIKLLDERMQLILNLIYVEELSLKEIAAILDVSISRVSQLHGKALAKLRSFY
jgi:RNA polymerase sigma factor for flagellar operon FliA